MRISDWSSDVCSSEAKRDRFREQLLGTKFRPLPVPGGYFQLADYSAVSDLDDFAFCRWLTIEKGVTAVPLSPFYETPPPGPRLVRLFFAKHEATLAAEIGRASCRADGGQYVD